MVLRRARGHALALPLVLALGCGPSESPAPVDAAAPPDLAAPSDNFDLATGDGPTGAPCVGAGSCAGGALASEAPACITSTKASDGTTYAWPGGYCSSPCRTTATSNQTGVNADCPGGHATCFGFAGSVGECRALCVSSKDCAAGYACFLVNSDGFRGCMPAALSQCDPSVRGSCGGHADAGVADLGGHGSDGGGSDGGGSDGGSDGGGVAPSFGETCLNVGDGTVGQCVAACDPYANAGCAPDDGCHASDQTGEGLCVARCTTMNSAGADCTKFQPGDPCGALYGDCPGGYGCFKQAAGQAMGQCWRYCNAANSAVQCSTGARCAPFVDANGQPIDPQGLAGICSQSM